MRSFTGHEIAAYRNAHPFPHLVIDDYLPLATAERVADEVAALPDIAWTWKNAGDGRTLHKGSINEPARAPDFARETLLQLCRGEDHLERLRELTGIETLVGDPGASGGPERLEGGGFHRIDRGGRLGVHVDFNTLKDRPTWRRRLNLLIYLNRDWRSAWGGDLQLWDEREGVMRIAPLFNRCVIFETSEKSWHGHPEPLACPPDRHRISMALYFYTHDATEPHRTTLYR